MFTNIQAGYQPTRRVRHEQNFREMASSWAPEPSKSFKKKATRNFKVKKEILYYKGGFKVMLGWAAEECYKSIAII